MRVLVTRPRQDAEDTASVLAARGHQALVAPMLETVFLDGPELDLTGIQALLATSANGVRALARRTRGRDRPVFAVGPQTSEAAHDAGFATVKNADGDAKRLAQMVPGWARPEEGALFHSHGGQGGALAEWLRAAGYDVRSECLYRVEALDMAAETAALLRNCAVDAALFFSPRSAAVFAEAVRRGGLPTENLIGVCISRATADALAPIPFSQIRIAASPNQTALLAALDMHNS